MDNSIESSRIDNLANLLGGTNKTKYNFRIREEMIHLIHQYREHNPLESNEKIKFVKKTLSSAYLRRYSA